MNTTSPARCVEHDASNWRHRAACRNEDPELFYLTSKEDTAHAQHQIAEAKAVCHRCPVRAECLDWALRIGDEFGILGGLSADERKPLRREGTTGPAQQERAHPGGPTKRCQLCRRVRSVTEFTSHVGRGDGLASQCKECHAYVRHQQRLQGPGQHRPRRKAAV